MNRGHKRIAFVEGSFSTSGGQQRKEGYQKAYAVRGMEPDPALMIEGDYTIDFGRETVKWLLGEKIPFDAIMTGSDLIAIGIVSELVAQGIRVPEDIEVMGYDDIELASVFNPPLSTMSKPHYKMAQYLAENLIHVIEGEPVILSHMLIEPQLVLRGTTKPD